MNQMKSRVNCSKGDFPQVSVSYMRHPYYETCACEISPPCKFPFSSYLWQIAQYDLSESGTVFSYGYHTLVRHVMRTATQVNLLKVVAALGHLTKKKITKYQSSPDHHVQPSENLMQWKKMQADWGPIKKWVNLLPNLLLKLSCKLIFQKVNPAVTWLKYCRYGVKLHPINQSINQKVNLQKWPQTCFFFISQRCALDY